MLVLKLTVRFKKIDTPLGVFIFLLNQSGIEPERASAVKKTIWQGSAPTTTRYSPTIPDKTKRKDYLRNPSFYYIIDNELFVMTAAMLTVTRAELLLVIFYAVAVIVIFNRRLNSLLCKN